MGVKINGPSRQHNGYDGACRCTFGYRKADHEVPQLSVYSFGSQHCSAMIVS
jgi:hypothetical protein